MSCRSACARCASETSRPGCVGGAVGRRAVAKVAAAALASLPGHRQGPTEPLTSALPEQAVALELERDPFSLDFSRLPLDLRRLVTHDIFRFSHYPELSGAREPAGRSGERAPAAAAAAPAELWPAAALPLPAPCARPPALLPTCMPTMQAAAARLAGRSRRRRGLRSPPCQSRMPGSGGSTRATAATACFAAKTRVHACSAPPASCFARPATAGAEAAAATRWALEALLPRCGGRACWPCIRWRWEPAGEPTAVSSVVQCLPVSPLPANACAPAPPLLPTPRRLQQQWPEHKERFVLHAAPPHFEGYK